MPEVSKSKVKKSSLLYKKYIILFCLSFVFAIIILTAGVVTTGFEIYGQDLTRIGILNIFLKFASMIGIFTTALIGILIVNFFWFKKNVVSPLSEIEEAIENIRKGNFEKRLKLKTGDEFQKIAELYNQLIDKISTFIQIEEEKKEMQNNIIQLLQIITQVSKGDFTQKAEVTSDVLGSLSDAFNMLIENLSNLIREIKNLSEEFEQKNTHLNEITQRLQTGADIQKEEIDKIVSFIEESDKIVNNTKEKASVISNISQEIIDVINQGNKIVFDTVNSIQLIKTAVQGVNKKIRFVLEKLTEINTLSTILSDIGNKTSLLALNASIEAARAGHEGRGFAVIAEEMKVFSEKTAKSSKEISEIISAIQDEATIITKNLEEETNYVETATNLISQSTLLFEKIDSVIKNIKQTIDEINESVLKHKEMIDIQINSVQKVREITENLSGITTELTDMSQSLTDSSKQFINITERFKV